MIEYRGDNHGRINERLTQKPQMYRGIHANIGEKVTVMGWVQKRRNLGSLIFIDLRDRSGLLQIVFDEDSVGTDGFAKAGTLRSEYVVAIEERCRNVLQQSMRT